MTTRTERQSRLIPIDRGRVGWTGLLEYVDDVVRAEVAARGGRPSGAAVAALERRFGVRLDDGRDRTFGDVDALTNALAHALAVREVTRTARPGTVRVRVGDETGFVEYDGLPTPYFVEQCREVVTRHRADRPVEIEVAGDVGLRAWVALGRALERRRRMNPVPGRQTDMTANDRPER